MSIELRSATGIRCALESIDDYSREPELSVCLGSLFLSKSLPDSIEAQLTLLLQQLGQQDALKSLEIRPVESENEKSTKYNPPSIYFPVNVVASAMFQARTCMKLGLENITLVGTEEDYERLAESLEGHPALASIVMQVHSLLQGDHEDANKGNEPSADLVLTTEDGTISPLDPVVHAFGSIEPLQSICLRQAAPIDSLNNLSNITIARISALPNLVHLKIFGFLLTDDNLEAMADELVDKLFLLELTLFCAEIGRVGFQALQAIVQENDNLASFRLFIRKFAKNEGGSLYKRFENVLHCVGKSKYKLFSLNVPNKFKTLCIEEVKKMIRGNTTIETVNMNRYSKRDGQLYKIQDDEVDFLVKMNKLGRGKLFHQKQDNEESKTDVTWGTMIEATGNDLSNIFSIVRSHPLEFAEMLSKDCTEEMPPTCKVMKILLKQQHHQLSRYFKQGFCTKEDFSAIIVPSAKTVQAVLKDNSVKLTTIIEKQVMEGTAQEAIKDALSCFAKENKEAIKTLTEELCSTKERLLWQTAGTQAKVLKTVEEAVQRNIQGDAEAIQCKLGAIEVQIKQNSQTFDKLLGRLEAVENGKSEAKQKQSVGVSFLTALLYLAIVVYGTISLSFMVFFCAIYFKTGIASASSF